MTMLTGRLFMVAFKYITMKGLTRKALVAS